MLKQTRDIETKVEALLFAYSYFVKQCRHAAK